jgi:SPFH domain / Band 7 family
MDNVDSERLQAPEPSRAGDSASGAEPAPDVPSRGARTTPAQRGRRVADQVRAAAMRAWETARHAHPAAARDDLSGAMAELWRWAPLLVPLALELALLALGASLVGHHVGHVVVTRRHLALLAVTLLAVGVGLAVALYRARDLAVWSLTLGLGVSVYLMAAALVLLEPSTAAVVALLMAAACAMLLRVHVVANNTLAVTTYRGTYRRALRPGPHALLPGEQLLPALPTGARRVTTLPQRATTASGVEGQATAVLIYQLIPEQASRAALIARDWDRSLQRMLIAAVRDELSQWGSDPSDVLIDVVHSGQEGQGDTSESVQRLQSRLEAHVATMCARWGVRIAHLELHGVILPSPLQQMQAMHTGGRRPTDDDEDVPTTHLQSTDGMKTAQLPSVREEPLRAQEGQGGNVTANDALPRARLPADEVQAAGDTQGASTPDDFASADRSTTAPRLRSRLAGIMETWRHDKRTPEEQVAGDDSAQPDSRASFLTEQDKTTPGAPPSGEASTPAVSSAVLASAYEAVREGRVSDPATIRQIAERFTDLAANSESESDLEFDPAAAARILHQRAEELALATGEAREDTTPLAEQGPSAEPHHAPPRVERDENVTSGG